MQEKNEQYLIYDEQMAEHLKKLELDSHGDLVMPSKEGYAELYDVGTLCVRDWNHKILVDAYKVHETKEVRVAKGIKIVRI